MPRQPITDPTTLNRHIEAFAEDARATLVLAISTRLGCRPDPTVCERALRAYFGQRWPGSSDRLSAVEVVEGSNFLHRLAGELGAAVGQDIAPSFDGQAGADAAPPRQHALPHHGDDNQWWDYARALHGEDARPRRRWPHPPAGGDDDPPDGGLVPGSPGGD